MVNSTVVVHLIRHAEGYHNVGDGVYTLPDPVLTPRGENQCHELRETHFVNQQANISLVIASPMRRTLHTAHLVVGPALANGHCWPRIFALPEIQEISDNACDIGSNVDVLQDYCMRLNLPVDLSFVKHGWNDKRMDGAYAPSYDALEERARKFRCFLREKAHDLVLENPDREHEVIVVTHGSFLHYLTNDWVGAEQLEGTGWENCETRSYVFETPISRTQCVDDEQAMLCETSESRRKRGCEGYAPDPRHQRLLSIRSMRYWKDAGYIQKAKP